MEKSTPTFQAKRLASAFLDAAAFKLTPQSTDGEESMRDWQSIDDTGDENRAHAHNDTAIMRSGAEHDGLSQQKAKLHLAKRQQTQNWIERETSRVQLGRGTVSPFRTAPNTWDEADLSRVQLGGKSLPAVPPEDEQSDGVHTPRDHSGLDVRPEQRHDETMETMEAATDPHADTADHTPAPPEGPTIPRQTTQQGTERPPRAPHRDHPPTRPDAPSEAEARMNRMLARIEAAEHRMRKMEEEGHKKDAEILRLKKDSSELRRVIANPEETLSRPAKLQYTFTPEVLNMTIGRCFFKWRDVTTLEDTLLPFAIPETIANAFPIPQANGAPLGRNGWTIKRLRTLKTRVEAMQAAATATMIMLDLEVRKYRETEPLTNPTDRRIFTRTEADQLIRMQHHASAATSTAPDHILQDKVAKVQNAFRPTPLVDEPCLQHLDVNLLAPLPPETYPRTGPLILTYRNLQYLYRETTYQYHVWQETCAKDRATAKVMKDRRTLVDTSKMDQAALQVPLNSAVVAEATLKRKEWDQYKQVYGRKTKRPRGGAGGFGKRRTGSQQRLRGGRNNDRTDPAPSSGANGQTGDSPSQSQPRPDKDKSTSGANDNKDQASKGGKGKNKKLTFKKPKGQ